MSKCEHDPAPIYVEGDVNEPDLWLRLEVLITYWRHVISHGDGNKGKFSGKINDFITLHVSHQYFQGTQAGKVFVF